MSRNKLKNHPINEDDVDYIIRCKMKNDLNSKLLHPHMFRHSHGSIMVVNGSSLNIVPELLGHENIQTTGRYLNMSKEHVKKHMNRSLIQIKFLIKIFCSFLINTTPAK